MDIKCPKCGSGNYETYRRGVNVKSITTSTSYWINEEPTYLCKGCGAPYNRTDVQYYQAIKDIELQRRNT